MSGRPLFTHPLLPLFAVLVGSLVGGFVGGCDLRKLPLSPDGGAGHAGAGQAGATGGAGHGGAGGTAGVSAAGTGGSAGSASVDGGVISSSDGGPDAPQCTNGSDCTPVNPCHEGVSICTAGGAASCSDTQRPQFNGTVCGDGMVCKDGACLPCATGATCAVAGKPCRTGAVSCMTGAPVCAEVDNQANGKSCGTAMVCQAGECVACQDAASCAPANACHKGALACGGAAPQCTDTNTPVTPGSACGADHVCDSTGACVACKVGASCAVAGKPCRTGTTTCNTGAAACVESGNVNDGTGCGTNQVCSGGACVSCTAGLSCTPANPCHAGTTSCAPIACADSSTMLTNGTGCGTNKVCSNGACVPCTAGASCQPTNPCKTGATSCLTGASVCAETGNKGNGTGCGNNQVCLTGACVVCTAGVACTPANPCHVGTQVCGTGVPVCTDTGTPVSDGAGCGNNLVCKSGTCVSCTAGVTCSPANPCKYGATSCATGASVCLESGNKPVGTLCGAGQSCAGGVKTAAAMCNSSQQCVAATSSCPNGCNAGGTDCSACLAGESQCPSGCRDLASDPLNCGGCNFQCATPPVVGSGSATCSNMTCGISCNAGYQLCGDKAECQTKSWGFEDGTTGGFSILRTDYTMAVTSISNSTSIAHSGTHALAIGVKVMGSVRGFEIGNRLCSAQSYVASNGQSVGAWFYLQPAAGSPPVHNQSYFGEHLYTEMFNGGQIPHSSTVNTWFQVVTPIESIGTQLYQIALEAYFNSDGTANYDWTGTIYVDDITIQ